MSKIARLFPDRGMDFQEIVRSFPYRTDCDTPINTDPKQGIIDIQLCKDQLSMEQAQFLADRHIDCDLIEPYELSLQ